MKADDLSGFSIWYDWNPTSVVKAPDRPGVYIFRLRERCFGRLRGESDLIYIGSATEGTIRGRLESHLHPDGSNVASRLRDALEVGPLQVAWKALNNTEEVSSEEVRLLRLYCQHHCELPPANRNEPAKELREVVRALEDWLRHEGHSPERAHELAEKLVEYLMAAKASAVSKQHVGERS